MQNSLKLSIGLLAAGLLLSSGSSHAVKMPKVDICHFDEIEGIFVKFAVSGNAVQPHLNHGDVFPGVDNEPPLPDLDEDCFVIILPDPIARAYIDVDADGAYDVTKDVDIAVLWDTDGSGGVSVGDVLELGQYPTTFDPCPDRVNCPNLGNFNSSRPLTVTTVFQDTSEIASGNFCPDSNIDPCRDAGFENIADSATERFGGENFINGGIIDIIDTRLTDEIHIDNDPGWGPSEPIDELERPSTTLDPFINVIIY